MSYWLLYGALVVTPGFLVGAGQAREAAWMMSAAAALNLVLSLVLTPELGLEGPALATAMAVHARLPVPAAPRAARAAGCGSGELARAAWLPAYSLGALLAGALVAVRLRGRPRGCRGQAAGLLGVVAYWLAYYALFLDAGERALVRGLLRRG